MASPVTPLQLNEHHQRRDEDRHAPSRTSAPTATWNLALKVGDFVELKTPSARYQDLPPDVRGRLDVGDVNFGLRHRHGNSDGTNKFHARSSATMRSSAAIPTWWPPCGWGGGVHRCGQHHHRRGARRLPGHRPHPPDRQEAVGRQAAQLPQKVALPQPRDTG